MEKIVKDRSYLSANNRTEKALGWMDSEYEEVLSEEYGSELWLDEFLDLMGLWEIFSSAAPHWVLKNKPFQKLIGYWNWDKFQSHDWTAAYDKWEAKNVAKGRPHIPWESIYLRAASLYVLEKEDNYRNS